MTTIKLLQQAADLLGQDWVVQQGIPPLLYLPECELTGEFTAQVHSSQVTCLKCNMFQHI